MPPASRMERMTSFLLPVIEGKAAFFPPLQESKTM